jgi:hypothetical protein
LQLSPEKIGKFIASHDNDAKAIKKELLTLVWYMRGGLSYSEAHMLTHEERELIGIKIEENLKMTKETGLPFF